MYLKGVLFSMLILGLPACRHQPGTGANAAAGTTDTTQTYWSVKQFTQDQVDTHYGQPYSLYRIATLNGKVDSSIVNFNNMEWGAIFKTFFATDISDKKYLGHYKVSVFDDNSTGNRSLVYEATDPDLFTRQLQISVDPSSNRILSVYIETAKKTTFSHKQQRLLYMPLKIIQIQEEEGNLIGNSRNLRVEYRFLQ